MNLTTTTVVDGFGRPTQVTDPDGNVTFYVYQDGADEVREYSGWRWNAGTSRYYDAAEGAVSVYREDVAGNYTETLSYVWTGTGGNALPVDSFGQPTGAESLTSSYADLQSLSRSLLNSAGQVTETLDYYNLSGLSYSTSTFALGTKATSGDTTAPTTTKPTMSTAHGAR